MRKIYKGLLLSGMVVGLSAGVATAASTINVYSDADSDSAPSPYRLAIEGYNSTTPAAVTDLTSVKSIIGVINVNALGPAKIEIAMTNGTIDAASGTNLYKLGLWTDANADGVIDAAEVKLVVNNAGSADTVTGNIIGGKLTFSAGTVMLADADGGDGGEVSIGANAKLVVLQMPNTSTTAASHATAAQGTTSTTAVANNVSARVGFNFSPAASLNTSTDSVTITVTENSGTASTAATLASFMNEYVAAVSNAANDYADNVVDVAASRKKFTNNGTTEVISVNIADRNTVDTSAAPYSDGTDYSGKFLATQAAGGGSISDIYVDLVGDNGAISTVKEDTNTTTITYDATNTRWRQTDDVTAGSVNSTFYLTVNTTDVISTRNFKAGVTSVPASSTYPTITYLSDAAAGSWTINGYQAVIPYISANTNYTTTCMISNANTSSADIFFDVLSAESGASLTGLSNLDVGSIAAGAEKRIDLGSSATPYLANNVVDTGNVQVLTGLSASDRYAGKLTITGTPANISVNCLMADPSGSKRLVPVFPSAGTNLTW